MTASKAEKTAVRAAVAATVLVLIFSALFLNSFGRLAAAKTESRGLLSDFNVGVTAFSSDALNGIYDIKRVYIIPESATVAPKPKEEAYHSCQPDDCGELINELSSAADDGLVNPDETAWNQSIATWNGTPVEYYHDETAFVIMWREVIDKCVYNFSEIYIAHPSQFRRMLTDDAYGSNTRQTTSTMSRGCNALVGMSGDFYGYRTPGVIVYKGRLCKNTTVKLDTCFVDKNGDLILNDRQNTISDSELESMIAEQGINFSLSFGPILVENGEAVSYFAYSLGQIDGKYSRAGIGQLGKLHYLLCTVDGGTEGAYGTTIKPFAQVFADKGAITAYTLDGGQTATIFYDNRIYNRVGYGSERLISDIIYFATAQTD